MRAVERFAPAKINCFLEVLNRRPDGYHELETVFHSLALGDQLRLRWGSRAIRIHAGPDPIPEDADNIAWQAVLGFHQAIGREPDVQLDLYKAIPAGAGLGGGSSDAAAALLACQELYDQPLTSRQLLGIARRLGADVAFFLTAGCAHALGRGDDLHPLPTLHHDITLVLPPTRLATPRVFRALTGSERGPRVACGAEELARRARYDLPGLLHNRLTAAACRLDGSLAACLQWLQARHGGTSMSGSGTTCFVLGKLDVAPPGCRLIDTRLQ
ncbi:MAG: 4-(cytidine 5'-diphospho)-2-C-methyl-D-erythritol kinase [Planctomycetota bacterium]